MLRRTQMNRGKGFKRPERARQPSSPLSRVHGGVQAMISDQVLACPKEGVLRSSTYEAAVRRLPCMRCGVVGFSQFCHADQGKGQGIKTDVRQGWPGCGPHGIEPGCHWFVGTSGRLSKDQRRAAEAEYAAKTRAEILRRGWWPAKLPLWEISK